MLFKILAILFVFIPAFFFWVLLGFAIVELRKKKKDEENDRNF